MKSAIVVWATKDKVVGMYEHDVECTPQQLRTRLKKEIQDNKYIELTGARIMIELTRAGPQGLERQVTLLPFDILEGPASELLVRPLAVFVPNEVEAGQLDALIDGAGRNEAASRAANSGLILPQMALPPISAIQ